MDRRTVPLAIAAASGLILSGCSTVNINAPQPTLQTINGGQPSCVIDCQTTQTATQSIGDGDVQGATVTHSSSPQRSNSLGGP